jgi:hypothetical protein
MQGGLPIGGARFGDFGPVEYIPTPVFVCGFECGASGTAGEHWSLGTNASFSTSRVRSGVRSLLTNANNAAASDSSATIPSTNIVVGRFYFFMNHAWGASGYIGWCVVNGTNVGVYMDNTNNQIKAGIGASLGTGLTFSLGQFDAWHCIDFSINTSANPWVVNIKLDGVSAGQITAANAANTTTAFHLGVSDAFSGNLDNSFDDLVLSYTPEDYPYGEGFVHHFIPVADGSHNTADVANAYERGDATDIINSTTTSFNLLDEIPMDNGTPDTNDFIRYVPNAGVNTRYVEHIFGPAPTIPTPTYAPRGVEVLVSGHEAGTGACDSTWKLNDDGTENTINARSNNGVTTIRFYRKHYARMPKDNEAWTVARFNNIRHRWGYVSDANPDVMFDGAMIEAEFAPVLPPGTGPDNGMSDLEGMSIGSGALLRY